MKFNSLKHFGWVAVLGLILTACNNSAPTNTQNGTQNTQTATPATSEPTDKFTVGLILVGPKNDAGWSQAHYEAMQYVIQKQPNVALEYVDKVNPSDRP
ncbi:MAG: hypothetical protein WBV73_15960, partial [Phormidium sp.]